MTDDSIYNLWPLERIGASADWFEAQLRSRGIAVHPRSKLASALANLRDLRTKALANYTFSVTSPGAFYEYYADAVGADFLTKAVHSGAATGFVLPVERWEMLTKGDPILTRPGDSSYERNLTWETVLASLGATFASDVRFAEPDVLGTYQGMTFAVAAKVGYAHGKLFKKNVVEGFEQADGKADVSLVFANVVSLYGVKAEYDLLVRRQLADPARVVGMMQDSVNRWCDRFELLEVGKRLRTRATRPVGVAFFVPMLVHIGGLPSPFLYTHMPLTWDRESADMAFATAFLGACNEVLGFVAPA